MQVVHIIAIASVAVSTAVAAFTTRSVADTLFVAVCGSVCAAVTCYALGGPPQ